MSILSRLREDLRAVQERDPAATSQAVVLLGYSGMHAIWAHRLLHPMWQRPVLRVPARLASQIVRFLTGVEIHPAASIGRRVVIDHGMGVVIGATAEVGDDCLIYHGVTLGGRRMAGRSGRHPRVGSRVLLGAGASVIGPVEIGDDSVVGAGAVVVTDAPAGSRLVGVPAVVTPRSENAPEFRSR